MAYTTINKSSLHQNTVLYSGNGSYGNGITGVGFQPDFVWIKNRSEAYGHNLYDAVRGTDKTLESETTDAERTAVNLLHSFDADGFTVDDDYQINKNTNNFVSWNWKANGAGSSNTDGSITSTVSVNTTAGFSIVKYTSGGSTGTVGHGLGSVPKVMFYKPLSTSGGWDVYHHSLGIGNRLNLHNTAALSSGYFQTLPTSSVFTEPNLYSGEDVIMYCFADVAGYSKFGSFEGNLNANGPFVYTGFKPQFILLKNADNSASGDEWFMEDAARSTYNPTGKKLSANLSNAETTGSWVDIDFLSNGFKIRTSDAGLNEHTMIYMAFGQSIVGTNNVPATAR